MFYMIHLWILHHTILESVLYRKVCYIYLLFRSDSYTAPELYLHFYWYVCASYNGVCIDIFCMLYNLIFGCTLSRIIRYISLLGMGFSSALLLLHSQLYWYVCKIYIYVSCDMTLHFLWYTSWLYSIFGSLSWIFPVYDLLCNFHHPHWPEFTKVD